METNIQKKIKIFVENPIFKGFITALIILTGIFLGLETSPTITHAVGIPLIMIERILIGFFVIEVVLKLLAYRGDYFKNPWFIFDLVLILALAVLAAISLPLYRLFRVLRLLRIIDRLEIFRKIIETILRSIPSIVGIVLLEVLLIFTYGVIGTTFFSAIKPDSFENLGISCLTMFQIITIEGWNEVAFPVINAEPISIFFFISFLLLGAFLLMNMFVSIMVSSMEDLTKEEVDKKHEERQQKSEEKYEVLLKEIQEIKQKLGDKN